MLTVEDYQNQSVSNILAMLAKNSLAHALLFSGIKGLGKENIAKNLAMIVNCTSAAEPGSYSDEPSDFFSIACKTCNACKKIISCHHPDVLTIETSGKVIKIGQIRDLCKTLQIKPVEALQRVIIINDAEKMNTEASNALLKMLEEPPQSTLFILIAKQTSDLLPTITSRCQQIAFKPVSSEQIKLYIQNKYNLPPKDASIIASISHGSPELADTFIDNPALLNKRNWIFSEFSSLKSKTVKDCMIFAEILSKRKDEVADLLDLLLTYIRDMIIVKDCPDKLINQDFTEEITNLSGTISSTSLLLIADQIQNTLKTLRTNASLKPTLELLVLKMARV